MNLQFSVLVWSLYIHTVAVDMTASAGDHMVGDRKVQIVFAVPRAASAGNPTEAAGNHMIVDRKIQVVFVVPETNLKECHNYYSI